MVVSDYHLLGFAWEPANWELRLGCVIPPLGLPLANINMASSCNLAIHDNV